MKKGCFWLVLIVDLSIVAFVIYFILAEGVRFESFYLWLFVIFAIFIILVSIPLGVYLFIALSEAILRGELPETNNLLEYYFRPIKIDSPYGRKIEILTKVLIASVAGPLQIIIIVAIIRDIIEMDFSFLRIFFWIILQIVVLFISIPKLEIRKKK